MGKIKTEDMDDKKIFLGEFTQDRMSRCKIAAKLAKRVNKEAEEAAFSGYITDFDIAYNKYITHIQDHGCWKAEE